MRQRSDWLALVTRAAQVTGVGYLLIVFMFVAGTPRDPSYGAISVLITAMVNALLPAAGVFLIVLAIIVWRRRRPTR